MDEDAGHSWEITIRKADNGYILEHCEYGEVSDEEKFITKVLEINYQASDKNKVVRMLKEVSEFFGIINSPSHQEELIIGVAKKENSKKIKGLLYTNL